MSNDGVNTAAPTPKTSNAWVWTLVKGVFVLALGLFLLLSSQAAPVAVAYALAIYMFISGAVQTFLGFTNRASLGSGTDRIRGLVGLIGGLALILLAYFDVLSLSTAYTILAILLIAYGALGLFEALFDRGAERFRFMPLLVNALLVLLGAMVFYSRSREFDLRLWSGVILAAIGLVAIGYGFFVQKPNPKVPASSV